MSALNSFITPRRRLDSLGAELRRGIRSYEIARILVCAVLGAIVGASVGGLREMIETLHRYNFALGHDDLLSTGRNLDQMRVLVVPALGGLILGVVAFLVRRFSNHEIVDPVEANALHGGRMSLIDSIRLSSAALFSNAAGASVGMEAGYSQLGAGFFSAVGRMFRLRREDERIFVTAGAAAAIAAAFNAPLAGAFYGFELILGQYTIRALTPVAVSAVTATLTQNALSTPAEIFHVAGPMPIVTESYLLFALLGVLAAGIGVVTMLAVTWSEKGLGALPVPDWLRPAIGGALLSLIALYFPQVLGSGHGAIQYHFDIQLAFLPLAFLVVAKIAASAISIGAGFRGGLFSSSLLLGCVFGAACARALSYFDPALANQSFALMLVGMGSVASAIIGAPFTMVFLVLESTGDLPLTMGVVLGVVTASTIVRLSFGYSFATWRFHQRGLGIRGAHDVGWIADLTVGRMMRSDPRIVDAGMTIAALRETFPLGSTKRVFLTNPDGSYLGSFDLAKAYQTASDDTALTTPVSTLVEKQGLHLYAHQNVRIALARFEETETEVLPVMALGSGQKIIGYLTEGYALRRYTQEMERQRSAELGEQNLFSIGPKPNT